jgi:catechol 2,3-dioxygenase-like lactoylglutathione lyase family enzyme
MPKLNGILETALYVDDLQRSVRFYQAVFGFEVIESGERLCAMGVRTGQVLLLFQKGASADLPAGATDGEGQLHLAFAISAAELDGWERWLANQGIRIEQRRTWERGAACISAIRMVTFSNWQLQEFGRSISLLTASAKNRGQPCGSPRCG